MIPADFPPGRITGIHVSRATPPEPSPPVFPPSDARSRPKLVSRRLPIEWATLETLQGKFLSPPGGPASQQLCRPAWQASIRYSTQHTTRPASIPRGQAGWPVLWTRNLKRHFSFATSPQYRLVLLTFSPMDNCTADHILRECSCRGYPTGQKRPRRALPVVSRCWIHQMYNNERVQMSCWQHHGTCSKSSSVCLESHMVPSLGSRLIPPSTPRLQLLTVLSLTLSSLRVEPVLTILS